MSEFNSDSESCPSYLTESESEHESVWGEDKEQKEVDYTATAKDIICENVNITTENALNLNSGYQNMLKVLKNKLEILLVQCQERQGEIEKQISEYRNTKKPLAGKSRTSGYICGQPYFKDEDLYPGPHNEDYLFRKNVRREFFPLDMFEVTDSNWTVKDKVNILKGVKMQIIEFIGIENRLKIKKIGNGLEAERLRREILSLSGKEIGDLWEKVKLFPKEYPGQTFEIDWLRISNVNINGRHSVSACIGIWNNYMIPGLVRSSWNHNEEKQLIKEVEKHNHQSWMEIAREVPGRSPYQCFVHYQTTFSNLAQIKHERWTEEEDELLVKLVDENRIGSNIVWNKVVEKMPLRNKIQCYNRYMFTLMRPMKHTKFTPEEDCIITAYVQECGDEFRFIPPNLLPGRTNRQIWARYNHTLKYVNKHSGWTIEEDYRLINFIRENLTEEGPRKISWAACSKALGNHSRLSCRTRYYTIEKFLEKNPDATLDDVPRKEKRLSSKVTNENWVTTMLDMQKEPAPGKADDQEMPSTSSVPKKQRKVRKKRDPLVKNRYFSDTIKCVFRKRFFEKLKYSFHYRFGDQFPSIEKLKVSCTNKAIFYLLHCTTSFERVNDYSELFTARELKFLRTSFSMRLNPGLVSYLQSARYCFLFPPNYNTILGLRGVVLNATYPAEEAEETSETVDPDESAYQYALENFRNRFNMAFFWTMLLVRQNPRDADLQNGGNCVATGKSLAEHVSLQQLTKLHNSRRLPRLDSKNDLQIEALPAQTATNTDNWSTVNQSSVHSSTKPHRKSRAPRRLGKARVVPTKEITITSTVEHSFNPAGDIPMNETPASFESMASSSINLLNSQLAPYQLHYSILPDYYGASSSTTMQPVPIYHTVPYTVTTSEQAAKPTDQMSLVAQITVINPKDLPAAQILDGPVLEGTVKAAAPGPTVQPSEAAGLEEHTTGGDQTSEIYEEVGSVERSHSESGNVLEQLPRAIEPSQNVVQESESINTGPNESITTVTLIESSGGAIESRNDNHTEQETDIESDSDSTAATSVGDFVIEEIEEVVSRSSSRLESPKPVPEKVETESHGLKTEELDDTANATPYSTLQNSHDLCIPSIVNTSPGLDISTDVSLVGVGETINGHSVTAESTLSTAAVDSDGPEWDMKILHAPKKTYNRSPKKRYTSKAIPHAWRWIHLEKANSEEIELHQDVWEECNPERMKFNPNPNATDSAESMKVPKTDEIIVIDDDEVEIKEEPMEVEEYEVAPVADGEGPDISNVDESCIQQIIQTANNILRMSRTYNMIPADGDLASRGSPPSLSQLQSPTMELRTSSSRIFDEQNNCYYFVDEILEETMNDMRRPTIENPQMCRKYPAGTNSRSLEARAAADPANDNPQSTSASNIRPLATIEKQSDNSLDSSHDGDLLTASDNRNADARIALTQQGMPKIGKPKRPPREQQAKQSRGAQEKALTLLDALYNQPRLTPSISSTAVKPLPASNHNATCATGHKFVSQKRQPSPEHSLRQQASKRSKQCDEESVALGGGKDDEYNGLLEQIDESFDAVDIISILSSMRQKGTTRVSDDDDSDDEDCYQPQTTVATLERHPLSNQPKHSALAKEKIPSPVSSTVTQQKVQTIVQRSTTDRSATNVQFKVRNK